MGFFNRFQWIFISPTRVFADVKEGNAPWWQPWVWISVIYVVVGYFSVPIQMAVLELNPNDVSADQLDQQIGFLESFWWLQLITTPIMMLVVTLIVAGLSYILVSILSDQANFKKYFTINLYSGIVGTLSTVLTTLVVRMRGIDSIQTVADARFSIGLGFLAPEEGALVRSVLLSVDFFSVWAYVLVVMGLMYVFGMSRKHAIYCIIPLWIMQVLFLVIGEVTGGMT